MCIRDRCSTQRDTQSTLRATSVATDRILWTACKRCGLKTRDCRYESETGVREIRAVKRDLMDVCRARVPRAWTRKVFRRCMLPCSAATLTQSRPSSTTEPTSMFEVRPTVTLHCTRQSFWDRVCHGSLMHCSRTYCICVSIIRIN